ncbi:MAG TPA: cytochrome C oxidase subunit I [Burkholderiaceae bacterium]|nr:cytochrome C oxidase subunit I [Burkholderiaceae bacterium]
MRRGRLIALGILLVCAAPIIASYFTYYVIRPEGRTNYGTLLEPLRTVGELRGTAPDGAPADLAGLRGRWVLLTGAGAQCDTECEHRLYLMRQLRLTTGKDRDRVERAWIVPADAQPPAGLLEQHDGLVVIRAADDAMAQAGFEVADGSRPQDHVWVLDPLGNLVLRYPLAPDASRMKKDLLKLLKASRIG